MRVKEKSELEQALMRSLVESLLCPKDKVNPADVAMLPILDHTGEKVCSLGELQGAIKLIPTTSFLLNINPDE